MSLSTGALLFAAVAAGFGLLGPALPLIAALAAAAAGVVKWLYWREIDTAPASATAESATGLGTFGRVRLLEAPHTEENYLMKEMGYRIARKHASKLRAIALVAGFGVPALAALVALAIPASGPRMILLAVAAVLALVGTLVERWLFFAEAKHSVTLYYGAAEV